MPRKFVIKWGDRYRVTEPSRLSEWLPWLRNAHRYGTRAEADEEVARVRELTIDRHRADPVNLRVVPLKPSPKARVLFAAQVLVCTMEVALLKDSATDPTNFLEAYEAYDALAEAVQEMNAKR